MTQSSTKMEWQPGSIVQEIFESFKENKPVRRLISETLESKPLVHAVKTVRIRIAGPGGFVKGEVPPIEDSAQSCACPN